MSRGVRKEGLSRRHRFVGRGSFVGVLRGARKIRGEFAVLHVSRGEKGSARFGITVSKRLSPRAVDRNRLKRIARELFRKHGAKTAECDLVLSPRRPFARDMEEAWRQEIEALLGHLNPGP
jgi:ribonuclease P protein component